MFIRIRGGIINNSGHTLSAPDVWVDKYADYLYSFAMYRIQDPETARELVQETFMAGLNSRKNFKARSSEKTWLTGILKHKIMDFFRRKYKDPLDNPVELAAPDIDSQFDNRGKWKTGPAEWAENPETLLEQKAFMEVVKKCLELLPAKQGRALALRELEGRSTGTICNLLNISATNCWVILHRARALMRSCIESTWLGAERAK